MVKAAAAAEAADLAAARLAEIAILLVAAVDVPHRELVLALARQELIRSAGVCRCGQVRVGACRCVPVCANACRCEVCGVHGADTEALARTGR